jgi:hypothetical protein
MKKIITSLLLVSILTSCSSKKTYHDNLGIPDRVEIKENENYIQFPDTRIFMVMPEGYELNASFKRARVRKNKQTFIDVTEEPNRSVDEVKEAFEQTVEEIEAKKPNSCQMQDFKLGDYDARFIYVSNLLPGTDKATLIFGNEKYAAAVGASFPNENPGLKNEIMDIMLTAYIKPDAKPDHTPFAKYIINLGGTGFEFNSFKTKNAHAYTSEGGDVENTPGENNFMIIQFADSIKSTADEKKEVIKSMVKNTANEGCTITAQQEKIIQLKGGEACEIVLDKTYKEENVKIKTYLLCFDVEGQTFILSGTMFKDFDRAIATYKHATETMKLK